MTMTKSVAIYLTTFCVLIFLVVAIRCKTVEMFDSQLLDKSSQEAFILSLMEQLAALKFDKPSLEYVLGTEGLFDKFGVILEFGVHTGRTLGMIADRCPNAVIVGFDSFEGLPETWRQGFDKGAFDMNASIPDVPHNVAIYKGWFEHTAKRFKQLLQTQHISLVHIDCDLYSSTKCILDTFNENIRDGTVVVFDELINYPGFDEHEIRALYEFATSYNKRIQVLGSLWGEEAVAVAVL
jgi:hypothetical protein